MVLYLGVIGKLHNNECLIYTFTEKAQNVTPIIFNKTLYNLFYKNLKNFSPVMIDTNHTNIILE